MNEVHYEFTLGAHVYEFTIQCNDNNIPYQLIFERDLFYDRSNVCLLNLTASQDNEKIIYEVKENVCNSFLHYFDMFPEETVFFDTDLNYKRNFLKFYKFFRWAKCYDDFEIKLENTIKNHINFLEIYINKKAL